MSGTDKLLSLLLGEGRRLVNFRLLPGKEAKSSEELSEVAHDALRQAMASDEDQIPGISKAPVSIGDLVSPK
jgi:hypothetical protein